MSEHRPSNLESLGVDSEPAAALEENVFQVLAQQARTRTTQELRVTTLGGLINAGLLWWQHPGLSWLAAGFAATAAYGLWGLLDRETQARTKVAERDRGKTEQLTGLRDLATLLGVGAALWALFGFMAATLGNWHH
jgi:hypothetical protein